MKNLLKTAFHFLSAALLFILALSCGKTGGTLRDIDSNEYRTIKIGSQVWMTENLKTTHYRNGDPITNLKDDKEWRAVMLNYTPAYCNYKNDEKYVKTYGRLYNWYTISDQRNIAPEGWHIPTKAEWKMLADNLGGPDIAGGKMKEKGTAHWDSPNVGAKDSANFTALAAGDRNNDGFFDNMGFSACWWTSTGSPDDYATSVAILHNRTELAPDIDAKICGFSIRCVKD